jgi:hypothetical protein
MGTTMPSGRPPLSPTAQQVLALGQATLSSTVIPVTGWTLPAVPLMIGTTTAELLNPTATHVLAWGQATPNSAAVPGTT